ncbi:MAG: serine/threonine-protein phosphatase [Synergistaceae bacterium]|nr:serine/threonine-protein phosphatase [Synergistaceae bacterium]
MAGVKFAVRSETGSVRTNNEDNFYCNGIYMTPDECNRPFFLSGFAEAPCIFAVFDGMGGHDCGELASLTAAETLSEYSGKILAGGYEAVSSYSLDAGGRLRDIMRRENIITGTTMGLVVVDGESFSVYNLGDSRIYRDNSGVLVRITDDHTVAEERVRMGMMRARDAEKSPLRHRLTRFLGMGDDFGAVPDTYGPFFADENRRVLLTTDGLNEMMTHREISGLMKESKTPEDAVNSLVDEALRRGGVDNVTCIALELS